MGASPKRGTHFAAKYLLTTRNANTGIKCKASVTNITGEGVSAYSAPISAFGALIYCTEIKTGSAFIAGSAIHTLLAFGHGHRATNAGQTI